MDASQSSEGPGNYAVHSANPTSKIGDLPGAPRFVAPATLSASFTNL